MIELKTWLDEMNAMRETGMLDNPTRETKHDLNRAAFAFMEIVGRILTR